MQVNCRGHQQSRVETQLYLKYIIFSSVYVVLLSLHSRISFFKKNFNDTETNKQFSDCFISQRFEIQWPSPSIITVVVFVNLTFLSYGDFFSFLLLIPYRNATFIREFNNNIRPLYCSIIQLTEITFYQTTVNNEPSLLHYIYMYIIICTICMQ